MIKHLVIDQARRWLSDPRNRARLKHAGRSAVQAFQDSRAERAEREVNTPPPPDTDSSRGQR